MRHDFPFVWFLVAFAAYTALLFLISWLTGRKAGSNSFSMPSNITIQCNKNKG